MPTWAFPRTSVAGLRKIAAITVGNWAVVHVVALLHRFVVVMGWSCACDPTTHAKLSTNAVTSTVKNRSPLHCIFILLDIFNLCFFGLRVPYGISSFATPAVLCF